MAPHRASSDLVAPTPEMRHADVAVFSWGQELTQDQDPWFRWPIFDDSNAFEAVFTFGHPSPVNLRISLWHYRQSAPQSGTMFHQYTIPYNTWVDFEALDRDMARGDMINAGIELLGDIGDYPPAVGALLIVRLAA